MKQKLLGSIAISMIAVIFVSMMAALPVAHAVPQIYLSPATLPSGTPSVGMKFNVTAYVTGYGTPPVFGWQVIVKYNGVAAGINVTRAWVGSAPGVTGGAPYLFAGMAEFAPPPNIVNQASVQIGSTLLAGSKSPPPDPALLGVIEFVILRAPAKFETLTTALDLGLAGTDTYLLDPTPTAILPLNLAGATYTWAWVAPTTNPHLAVSPTSVTFGPFPPSAIGSTFPVDVNVANLDIGWALTSAAFTLSYNSTVIGLVSAVADAQWTGPNTIDTSVPGIINVAASTTNSLSGTVPVLHAVFQVLMQGNIPPLPSGSKDTSPLTLTNILLQDHIGPVTTTPAVNGLVTVNALMTLPQPFLSVDPSSITMGPDLVIGNQFGKTFTVNVNINDLHKALNLVGIEFRLSFDHSLVQVLSVAEGPYLSQFPNRPSAPFTFFVSYTTIGDPVYGDHVLVGDLLLPSDTGVWSNVAGDIPETGPLGSGTVATITFAVLKQSFVDTFNMPLNLLTEVLIDKDANNILPRPAVNGMLTILPISTIGRRIDVWMLNYPAPFGGQGLDQPADLVVPQQIIELTAKVTYNWWPVAQKKVTFNVYDNQGNPVAVLEGITGNDGHAYATYRMPWPNVNPEGLFGVWKVIASVSVADVTISDTLQFHYDYLVTISSVTTNKLEYAHLEAVAINVQYASHAQQHYNVVMTATIQDNLLVPVGLAVFSTSVGGTVFCTAKTYVSGVSIIIPYWAYAGAGTVRVDFLDKLPSELTHVAVTPESSVGIYILPV